MQLTQTIKISIITIVLLAASVNIAYGQAPNQSTDVDATGQVLSDGDLIRGEDGIKVYIIKGTYKRHIFNPAVFAMYGHLKWENIKEVTDDILNSYITSNLYRYPGDEKVYIVGGGGVKLWIENKSAFDILKFSEQHIFNINEQEKDFYTEKTAIDEATAQNLLSNASSLVADVLDAQELSRRLTEKIQELALESYADIGPAQVEEELQEDKSTATTTDDGLPEATTTDDGISDEATGDSGAPGGGGPPPPPPPSDTTAPAQITNLSALNATKSSIDLSWTAPGDDGNSGTAKDYIIKYSTTPYAQMVGWFILATKMSSEPAPGPAGTAESTTVSRLSAGTTYYFVIKTRDEVLNKSSSSNVASITTASDPDTIAPDQITNLSASNATQSSIDLSWTAPGDDGSSGTATSYDVMYSRELIEPTGNQGWDQGWRTATQVSGEPAPQIVGTSESMTVSGLSSGATYYFNIRTSDEAPNWSGLSSVVSSATLPDTIAPDQITNLSASNASQSSIDLSWTAPGDDGSSGTATSYDVRYSTSVITEGSWASATHVSDDDEPTPGIAASPESMTVTGFFSDTTYYFAVKTSDEVSNESGLSNVVNLATLSDIIDPADITNLSASNATQSSIDLSWTAPGDDENSGTATTYDVRYSTSVITEGSWISATQVDGVSAPKVAASPESMTVSGLSSDTTYYFAIETFDEVQNASGLSNVVSYTTAIPDTIAPDQITNLSASNASQSSIDLSWTAPGDDGSSGTATSYDVRYSTSIITDANWSSATQASGEPTPSIAASSESMTVSGLSSDTTYYFAVKTSDEVPNESGLSNVVNITTLIPDNEAPSAIVNLFVSNATQSSIDLSWTAPGDDENSGTATSYDVRYSTSIITDANWSSATQASGEPTPSIAASSESMTVSGLSSDTTYYFAVKTSDEVPNESTLSIVASLKTTSPTTCGTLASGNQIYFASTQLQPQIMQVDLIPQDVGVGETQTVSVKIRDTNNNSITSVTGSVETDGESPTLSFSLVSGTDLNGTWEASWVAQAAICNTYIVTITATSASGASVITLSIL